MSDESLHLAKPTLAYAKLSATPTEQEWSQVYNAGNLFVCLALTQSPENTEATSLQTVGKSLFNHLESEFFTLEEKNLTSIKEALEKSVKQIPETVTITMCVAYFKDTVLYLFTYGKGRIMMKREENIGTLLTGETQVLKTASGFLENNDTILLQTDQFSTNVTNKQITEALQLTLPNDIAEALSVPMHASPNGAQAAIIIVIHGIHHKTPEQEETKPHPIDETDEDSLFPTPVVKKPFTLPTIKLPTMPPIHLNHLQKLFLSITIILALLLTISIVFTIHKQQDATTKTLFESVYTPANKNYEEGKALESLNQSLSQEDFKKAASSLTQAKDKFAKGSTEAKQIEELLAKVTAELTGQTTEQDTTKATEATVKETDMLALVKANPDGKAFNQNADTVFFVTDKAVMTVNKTSGKKEDVITNDDAWTEPVGIAPYQGNIYVLDRKNGVIKYVASTAGFGKNAYFKTAPDLSQAVGMSIDSSVYILFQDSTIKKYTRGEPDTFTIKGVEKPFGKVTKIFTDKDTDSVYLLDSGKGSIIKLSKDGTYQTHYTASIIHDAKDFSIFEKDKKAFVLSNDKVWEIPL